MSNMCDLPEELLKEVLLRVSPEMVPRLKCVSKSLQTLMYEYVMADQLICLSSDNHLYMSGCMDSPEKMKASLSQIEPKIKDKTLDLKIIGSCNGVVCLLFNRSKLVVFNPCTKQGVELPPFDADFTQTDIEHGKVFFGFGYDNDSKDYKVVSLQRLWKSRNKVKVYSLKSKCWRDVGDDISYYPSGIDSCVFVNGALHWLMITRDVDDYAILALDLSTEKYHLVPLPREMDAYGRYSMDSLVAVDGFLSLLSIFRNEIRRRAEVWSMKKYGVPDSWTKLSWQLPDLQTHSMHLSDLDLEARRVRPVMHWKNRLICRSPGDLIWHATENKVEDLMIADPPGSTWKEVIAFSPSLVHLPEQV